MGAWVCARYERERYFALAAAEDYRRDPTCPATHDRNSAVRLGRVQIRRWHATSASRSRASNFYTSHRYYAPGMGVSLI